jgi:hypothetical protein
MGHNKYKYLAIHTNDNLLHSSRLPLSLVLLLGAWFTISLLLLDVMQVSTLLSLGNTRAIGCEWLGLYIRSGERHQLSARKVLTNTSLFFDRVGLE